MIVCRGRAIVDSIEVVEAPHHQAPSLLSSLLKLTWPTTAPFEKYTVSHSPSYSRTHESQIAMNRGKCCDIKESCMLALACLDASKRTVPGADRKSRVFFDTKHRRFIEKGPEPACVVKGRYGFLRNRQQPEGRF